MNWGKWSETSKSELRVAFEIKECNLCKTLFKSCSGFYGNGKRGYLRGFYDSIEDPTAVSCASKVCKEGRFND